MPVADDWQINYVPFVTSGLKEIVHVDGILSYDTNTGTAPSLNDYIYQASTGAAARVIGGSDLGGTNATGTLNLTNVIGQFANNGALEVLSEVPFDTVGGTPQGFSVGDVLTGPTTESITVRAIEYNEGPKVALDGEGVIYGNALTTGFADNEQIDNSTTTATAVALVNGSESNHSTLFTGALANGTLAVPGTANTNNSVIIHYDAGTIDIPVQATVADGTSGAVGVVAAVNGVTATGSLRLVDSDTTGGAWTNNNALEFNDVVFYNAQVAGEVFQEGSVYEGQTSNNRFRVLKVIDDGDSTGKLITAGKQGAMTLNEDLNLIEPGDILGAKIAQVENTTTVLQAATLNLPGGVRTEQRAAAGIINQGGIYAAATSLNIVRRSNELFSYIKGTVFPQVAQLDDKPAIDGNVRDSLYTVLSVNGWSIPGPSFRFLDQGAWKDSGNNNIWTNYVAGTDTFTAVDITDNGFLYTATNPTPMPQAYVKQGDDVLPTSWLEGPFDVIQKVKTTTDVRFIDGATPALGQLLNGGAVEWFSKPYGRKFSVFDNSAVGSKGTIVLANANDTNNDTGQYRYSFNTGGAGAFTVGEEISTSDGTKIGIVFASDTGVTGNVDYALKSDTQFADTDVITGSISGKTATLDAVGLSNLVAGYGSNVRIMVVDILATSTPAAVVTGTFIAGEPVTQAVTSAAGYLLRVSPAGDELYIQVSSGTFSGDNTITGSTSAATWNPGVTTQIYDAQTTVPFDLGEGSGLNNYAGVAVGNITGASARPVLELYEWSKFRTDEQSISLEGGRGSIAGVEGRVYRGLDSTFTEVPEAPYGAFAAGIWSGAEGLFIWKETLDAADLQNLRVTPIAGTELIPPNLQNQFVANVGTGWSVFSYRSAGAGSEDPLVTEFEIGAGNLAANSTIVVQAGDRTVTPLPADVPDTGVLKIEDPSNAGIYLRAIYDSVNRTTNTFSLEQGIGQNTIGDITGGSALTQADNAWVAFIEEVAPGAVVSNPVQFIGNINSVGGARKKGFDDFISPYVFGSTGGGVNVVQTPDGVVDLP